jgi:ribonuclease-3
MSWAKRLVDALFGRRPGASVRQGASAALPHDFPRLEKALQYSPRDRELFVQALLHRSYHQKTHEVSLSNERMEFLGDSVLNLIVGEYLYTTFPAANEGELTKIRSRLVNKHALATYAGTLQLSEYILMSQSAAQTVGKGMETIEADAFEAVVAALYLDGGYPAAKAFVERQIVHAMKSGAVMTADDNYKSMLLEYAQAKGLGVPRYVIVKEEGPDHDRRFTIDVLLNTEPKGSGSGRNKKEAEQAAAHDALQNLL